MPKFASREEYERWKAAQAGRPAPSAPQPAPQPASQPAAAAAPGFSIAKTKPRRGLMIVAALLLGASSIYGFAIGETFAGIFVLALCALIAGVYFYYRLNPQFDDPEYLKATLRAGAGALLHHGHASEQDLEAFKAAKKDAIERHQAAQPKKD
jgi:hypothetical protein